VTAVTVGGPDPVADQGHLAEVAARPEPGDLGAVDRGDCLAVGDDEEPDPVLGALGDDHGACREGSFAEVLRELLEVLPVEALEHGHARQRVNNVRRHAADYEAGEGVVNGRSRLGALGRRARRP
jgi:hypothetical protein